MALVYSPYLRRYVETASPLTIFTFKVTNSQTGIPVAGAACAVTDQPETIQAREGAGAYTDINGECTVEALFHARYYHVSKAGYVTARGSIPGSLITVALDPTTVMYWVAINAGTGGAVNPSGTYQVAANTRITITATPQTGYLLDYWLINGVKGTAINPFTVTVDRDSYAVYAVFKASDVPPPPPEPPPGETWPYPIQLHVLDNVTIAPGIGTYGEVTQNVGNVDATKILGGKLDITIAYGKISASKTMIYWNGTLVGTVEATPGASGTSVTKSYSLTGLIRSTNTLKVAFEQPFLGFGIVTYDAYVTLGYSEKPAIDPSAGKSWLEEIGEWAKNNSALLIVGGVGVAGVYTLTRKGPPTFVVQVPQIQYRRREEEEE